MTVGERIQYLRKLNQMSQEELAKRLLISRQTVSLWENGQTLPTIDNLIRLREVFGISVDEMLVGISDSERSAQEAATDITAEYEASRAALKPRKHLKLIAISALAIIALLAIAVTFVFVLKPDPYGDAERALGCELPPAVTVSVSRENTDTEYGKIVYTAEIYFSATDIAALSNAAESCGGWLSEWESGAFSSVIPGGVGTGADGITLYTKGVGYNTLREPGAHYFVLELFAAEGMLRITSVRT